MPQPPVISLYGDSFTFTFPQSVLTVYLRTVKRKPFRCTALNVFGVHLNVRYERLIAGGFDLWS